MLGDRGRELAVEAQVIGSDSDHSGDRSKSVDYQIPIAIAPELETTKTTFNEAKINASRLVINPPKYAPAIADAVDNVSNADQQLLTTQLTGDASNEPEAIANPSANTAHNATPQTTPEPAGNINQNGSKKVYGREYLEQILGTMLPHRKIAQQMQDINQNALDSPHDSDPNNASDLST
jgi:hypothetical protein